MVYVPRLVDSQLDQWLGSAPVIAITGAKGVGKTTTMSQRAAHTLALDQPAERRLTEANPAVIRTLPTPLLIDEWQRVPPVLEAVHRAMNRSRSPGQFLLTGSTRPETAARLPRRGVTVRMRPLSLPERGLETPTVSLARLLAGPRAPIRGQTAFGGPDYAAEIVASGLPGIRLADESVRREGLSSYLTEIVDRDLPGLGADVRRPRALLAWLAAYAAATATTASYTTIFDTMTGEGAPLARHTADGYRALLERLWVLDPLPAWTPTATLPRLTTAPKHHLVDPGLAAAALHATVDSLLAGHGTTPGAAGLLGALFESLATQTVRVLATAAHCTVTHLRTPGATHEINLIIERGDHRVVAMAVKLAATVPPVAARHLHWLGDQIGDSLVDKVILTAGPSAYRDPRGVAVVPLALLGP